MTSSRTGNCPEHRPIDRCDSAKSVQLVCQKRPTNIAKSVQQDHQNGSTGLVSFYECDRRVSLGKFLDAVLVRCAGVAIRSLLKIGGAA
jgi:hypothetical protein